MNQPIDRYTNKKLNLSIGLLGASFETQNFGVAALTCGAVTAARDANENARIFIIDYAKKPACYSVPYGNVSAYVELVNIRFSKRFYLHNNIARLIAAAVLIRLLPSCRLRSKLIYRNCVLKTIWEADIFGAISGGDSFSDIYGVNRLLYIALPQLLVLLLRKRLIILPQTLGPFKRTFSKIIAKIILRNAYKVYSRDFNGVKLAKQLMRGESCRIGFCYDMGFVMEPRISNNKIPKWLNEFNSSIPLIGLNVSGLLWMKGYNRRNMFGLMVEYDKLIYDIVRCFIGIHNAHIMLVPHVLGTDNNSESDVVVCRKICNEAKQEHRSYIHCVDEKLDQNELKAIIGKCQFFIGSRMHACIAALSQNIPAVGLAYSGKFLGVFQSIGMENLIIDLRSNKDSAIIQAIENIYKKRVEFRSVLEERNALVKKVVLSVFSAF